MYALIALGYTMVYGIIKLINFAHGDFIMVGGYSLFFTIPVPTLAFWVNRYRATMITADTATVMMVAWLTDTPCWAAC